MSAKKASVVSPARAASKNEKRHILIRVRSDDGQTILGHDSVLRSKGVAMLGKMGKPLGDKYIEELNNQISANKETYLFLTTREGWNGPYVTFQCILNKIHKSLPIDKEEFIPRYYYADRAKVTTWFEISGIGKMSKAAMNRIVVCSSGRTIMGVIKSSAVVFHVSYPGAMCERLQRGDVKGGTGVKHTPPTDSNLEEDGSFDHLQDDDDLSGLGIHGIN